MADEIQNNLETFAASVGAAVKPLRYLPAKPAAGTYELSVNAEGAASWTAPAPAAAATPAAMDYAYLVRQGDQTNVVRHTPIVYNRMENGNDVDNPNGFSISTANNDIIFWPTGYVELKANRTYLLRATMNILIPSGLTGVIDWAYKFSDTNYAGIHQGFGKAFQGAGNVQCIVVETLFRPTANQQIWLTILTASNISTAVTIKNGSTAFVQRIA